MFEILRDQELLDLLLEETPQSVENLRVRNDLESPDYLYILSYDTNDMVTLNRTGKVLFEMCDGKTPVREMVRRLRDHVEPLSDEEALKSIVFFIRDLQKKGIVYRGSPHIVKDLDQLQC